MDLSQLEYFRALAHIRHFTKAAASISISQSALSRSITKLENELGHPLFDRTGHEISLTPDGQRFLIHVERALSEIEEGRRELDHENDPQGGIINLSFIHSLGTYMLPVLLSEFKVQNPSTRFNLQQNDSTLLAQGLIDGTSDLCLGFHDDHDEAHRLVLPLFRGNLHHRPSPSPPGRLGAGNAEGY